MKHLDCLLSQNIGRAFRVNSALSGGGGWVWQVCIKRNFVENMVLDRTSFHEIIYGLEYEKYVEKEKSVEHFNLEK